MAANTEHSQNAKRKSSLRYEVLTKEEVELARQEVKRFTKWLDEQWEQRERQEKAQAKKNK